MHRIRIKKGDEVAVITGANKGETGTVLEVNSKTGLVIVEGVNVRKRAWKRGVNPNYPDGGIHEHEMPIQSSNVQIIDPETGDPTRIGIRYEEGSDGGRRRVRYAKGSGVAIPEQF